MSNSSQQDTAPFWLRLVFLATITLGVSSMTFAVMCVGLRVPGIYRMAKQGASAEGSIIAKEQQHGGLVVYSFKVDSLTYSDRDGIGAAFDTARVGDRVAVVYDPIDPTTSALGHTEAKLWQSVALSVFVSALFGIFGGGLWTMVVWNLWNRRRRGHRERTDYSITIP